MLPGELKQYARIWPFIQFLVSTLGIFLGSKPAKKAPRMNERANRRLHPRRRRLLFGLGSAARAWAISPALAITVSVAPPSGSENRVSQGELDRIFAGHQLWLDRKTSGALANFSSRDLSGLKFGHWELRHARFAGRIFLASTRLSLSSATRLRCN